MATTTADDLRAEFGFNTPFQAQLDFFRAKLNLPSERWDDIKRAANDRAFIVAGAAKADLLDDLRQAVDDVIAKGIGIGQFRQEFREIVARRGWTGWTGEGTKAGEAWRTRVIYKTNLSASYAAGRYSQMTDHAVLRELPYWQYVHRDGVMHPRPLHLAWNGLTLPADHAFWRTHYAPNGWGCQCRIRARRRPAPGHDTPPAGWDTINPLTDAPMGIDRGWDYAPGANRLTPLLKMVDDKLITYPPAIAKALAADIAHLRPKTP